MRYSERKKIWVLSAFMSLLLFSCDSNNVDFFVDGGYSLNESGDSIPNAEAGVITAGEWNDLDHWDFWQSLLQSDDSMGYDEYPIYWGYRTDSRVPLRLTSSGKALVNAEVVLKKGNTTVWETKTDNLGRAELWLGLTTAEDSTYTLAQCQLYVNGTLLNDSLKLNQENMLEISATSSTSQRVELAFMVDATGSMSDEMDFLKEDLQNVIDSLTKQNTSLDVYTAALFYRDEGDNYVTKNSDFTNDLEKTLNYIKQQKSDGGGDYPEAVHTAMDATLQLQWSTEARTRIVFMLLDAPPHYEENVVSSIHQSVKAFAAKGIKLIPIAASGIEKDTEFLLRYFAMATNGTYVFITNDSGVGGLHIKPSVGEYQVEHLNALMLRLIKKYSD